MHDFIEVASTKDVPASGRLSVEVDEHYLIIIRVDDEYYCIDDVCTHDGGTFDDGELNGYCISCPRHGAEFDIRNGNAVTMPATEPTGSHEVRVDGEKILVRIVDR